MLFVSLALKSNYVQTKLAKVATAFLSSRLNTTVQVDRLEFRPFNGFTLKGFLVLDQRADTLIYSEILDAEIEGLDFDQGNYAFDEILLSNAQFNLFKLDSSGRTNLTFLIEYLTTDKESSDEKRFALSASKVTIQNSRFSYESLFGGNREFGVDFNNVGVNSIDATFNDILANQDSAIFTVAHLDLQEKSGFTLLGFQSEVRFDSLGFHTKDLKVLTPSSQIAGDVSLLADSMSYYRDFLQKVKWDTEFRSTTLNFKDIGYFIDNLYQVDFDLTLDGRISGPISNLKGRSIEVGLGERTSLRGNIDLSGLPDFTNTFIDFRLQNLRTDYDDLKTIEASVPSKSDFLETLPVEIDRAGPLIYSGYFTGFPEDFVTFGNLQTDAGSFELDLNLERDTTIKGIHYLGSLEAIDVDLGKLVASSELGQVSGKFVIDAYSRDSFESAKLQGQVSSFELKDYAYKNLQVFGTFSKQRFEGSLISDDPNFLMSFDGIIDLSRIVPFYDFDANIANIDLSALKLVDLDEELSIATTLSLNGRGDNLNNAAGKLTANQTLLCLGDSTLFVDDLRFTIYGDSINRKLSFTSSIIDVSITGIFDPLGLKDAFTNMVAEVMPSIATPVLNAKKEVFQFSLNYQSSNVISSFLLPGLSISKGTSAYGAFDSEARKLELSFFSPGISYKNYSAKGLSAELQKNGELIKNRIYANQFLIDSLSFDQPDVDIEVYNSFVDLKTGWFGATGNTSAQMELHVDFLNRDHVIIEVEPGYFSVRDLEWVIDEQAVIEKDSTRIDFNDLSVHAGPQTVTLNGRIGETLEDVLNIEVKDFDLSSLDLMGIGPKKNLQGTLNLNGDLTDFYSSKSVEASGGIKELILGSQTVGDVNVLSFYNNDSKILNLEADLIKGDLELISFQGDYNPNAENQLSGNLILDDFNLSLVNEFNIPQVSNFSGTADGEVEVSGSLFEPQLSGAIQFDEARFTVNYLNTEFVFDDEVRVEPDYFGIDYKPIYDSRGTKGYVVASAFHEGYANWTYDISADVDNFFILNTDRDDNSLYYGKAFGSGTVQLGGYEKKLEVNIDASAEEGTEINLPLDSDSEVALENFVHFVNKEEDQNTEREVDLSGITMRLNVDATPGAKVRIIFDEKAGDILQGNGVGRITLETTEGGDFNMFGRYEIYSGDYNFTLKNLISKRFTLLPGGTISWYGDPYQADLNLAANYSVRTPLEPIMIENREQYRSRELVNVVMDLGGKLLLPTIDFEIQLPQATENERTQLASAVSTVNQLNQQVFSLLILNKFFAIAAPDQAGSGVVTGLAAVTNTSTSEFISNQLSGWLSEISNEFDIGFNYRPGDEITNEEIAVALSTQLFDERLLVSGSFGVTNANEAQVTEGQSGILGDFLLEYMLTPDGRIRLKVFNETNPYEVFSTSTSMYTQGVGLIYQEDFNTIDEFFKKIGELFKDDKAQSLP